MRTTAVADSDQSLRKGHIADIFAKAQKRLQRIAKVGQDEDTGVRVCKPSNHTTSR